MPYLLKDNQCIQQITRPRMSKKTQAGKSRFLVYIRRSDKHVLFLKSSEVPVERPELATKINDFLVPRAYKIVSNFLYLDSAVPRAIAFTMSFS